MSTETKNNTDMKSVRKSHLDNKHRKWGISYLFMLPTLILVAVFLIYPLIRACLLSLNEWSGLGALKYVGFDNYTKLFKSSSFWNALSNTFIYAGVSVVLTIIIGLFLAICIERRVFAHKFYKFIFYISVMLSVSVVSILFIQLLEPNYGLLNTILKTVGLDSLAKSWLSDPNTALWCVIFTSVWQYSGFTMLLFLAAMEGIDPSIHEAAELDGVSEIQRVFLITLPIIKRSIFVVIMTQIIFSIKSFDVFWIMTGGGPGEATETLTTLLYRNAMAFGKYGYACSIAVVMIIIISAISIVYIKKSHLGDQVVE